jgi:hypothetical protein
MQTNPLSIKSKLFPFRYRPSALRISTAERPNTPGGINVVARARRWPFGLLLVATMLGAMLLWPNAAVNVASEGGTSSCRDTTTTPPDNHATISMNSVDAKFGYSSPGFPCAFGSAEHAFSGIVRLAGYFYTTGPPSNLTLTNIQVPDLSFVTKDTPPLGFKVTSKATGNGIGDFDTASGAMSFALPVLMEAVSTDSRLNLGKNCKFTTIFHLTTETQNGQRYKDNATPYELKLADNHVVLTSVPDLDCGSKDAVITAILLANQKDCLKLNLWAGLAVDLVIPPGAEIEPNNDYKTATPILAGAPTASGAIKSGDVDEFATQYTVGVGQTFTLIHKMIQTSANAQGGTCDVKGTTVSYDGPLIDIALKDYLSQALLTTTQNRKSAALPAEPPENEDGCRIVTIQTQYTYTVSYKNAGTQAIRVNPRLTFKSGAEASGSYEVSISLK